MNSIGSYRPWHTGREHGLDKSPGIASLRRRPRKAASKAMKEKWSSNYNVHIKAVIVLIRCLIKRDRQEETLRNHYFINLSTAHPTFRPRRSP
jgi:hypothetical protein